MHGKELENGVLEWWSNGVMGLKSTAQYSNTPVLHYSNLSYGFD
jgi:hypothetical protein